MNDAERDPPADGRPTVLPTDPESTAPVTSSDGSVMGAADGAVHRLDPRWIAYRRRVGWAKSAGLALGLAAAGAFAVMVAELPAAPIVMIAVVLVVAGTWRSQWWPALSYRYASYRLSTRALEIRRGVLWRSIIDVPRSRIQHSDVSQGPFERMHGLGTLGVYTAGTKYALVRLHGLDHDRALAMREHLMQTDDDDVI
jgi:membrane protein YdbS with pleckstrin-like domain